jgi:hypothetical protein
MQNEVYWFPTFIFFGIPNFGIGIPISQFFNSRIQEKIFQRNLWNQKRNQNSTSDGGPRNRNQKPEFPTKASDDDGNINGGKSDGDGDEGAGQATMRAMAATTVAAMRVASNEEGEGGKAMETVTRLAGKQRRS